MATDGNRTYVYFLYRDLPWGDSSTVIGFNAGDGVRSFTLPLSQTNSVRDIVHTSNIGVPGVYIFRVDQETILQPPITIGKILLHNIISVPLEQAPIFVCVQW